jgi:hypothetical protein
MRIEDVYVSDVEQNAQTKPDVCIIASATNSYCRDVY